jgi:hypothetical protein
MTVPPHTMILDAYCDIHARTLAFGETLTDDQLIYQAAPGTLTIAFFLWHLARWADHLQAAIPGMTPTLSQRLPAGQQIWEVHDLAAAWGFQTQTTGYAETGMHMDEAAAANLRFPPKEILLGYVRQAFQAAEQAVRAIDETQFAAPEQPQPMTEGIWSEGGSVGSAIFSHLLHDCQHYGMMESLLSQQRSTL